MKLEQPFIPGRFSLRLRLQGFLLRVHPVYKRVLLLVVDTVALRQRKGVEVDRDERMQKGR